MLEGTYGTPDIHRSSPNTFDPDPQLAVSVSQFTTASPTSIKSFDFPLMIESDPSETPEQTVPPRSSSPSSLDFEISGSKTARGRASTKEFICDEDKEKYLKRRQNNNQSAQKSRMKKRQQEQEAIEQAKILKVENERLRTELQKLQSEAETLKQVVQQLINRGS